MSHLVCGSWISVVLFDDTVDPLKIGFGFSIFSFRLNPHRKFFLSITTLHLNEIHSGISLDKDLPHVKLENDLPNIPAKLFPCQRLRE